MTFNNNFIYFLQSFLFLFPVSISRVMVKDISSSRNSLDSMQSQNSSKDRLLVVSNRLPVSMAKDADGNWQYKMSSGGLVSALSGLKKMMTFTWIGWPGQTEVSLV